MPNSRRAAHDDAPPTTHCRLATIRRPSQGRVIEPGAVDLAHGAILYLEDITVSFDGFKALNNLSLMIETGELRCIIGPNGAGKTTMMDVITGKTRADTGTAFFGQNIDLSRLSEAEIAHAGIGRKFQKPTVFEHHTVFENLELAMKMDKRVRHSLIVTLDSAQRDKIRRDAHADPPRAMRRTASPACSRTDRSSGSKSACC